jgi:hypothetical protein
MKRANWKQYGFEFLSIFIAVISAFALSNWNDNRRDHRAETKILAEIYNGLEKDLADIRLNISGHEAGIRAGTYFSRIAMGEAVATDSLLVHYFSLTRDFIALQNRSGYETLQSRGLELIENDSLRTQIIATYEYDYTILQKFEEEYAEMQFYRSFFQEINRLLAANFQFDAEGNFSGMEIPLDLSPPDRKLLLSYLWKIKVNRNFILYYYRDVEQKVTALRAAIEAELAA